MLKKCLFYFVLLLRKRNFSSFLPRACKRVKCLDPLCLSTVRFRLCLNRCLGLHCKLFNVTFKLLSVALLVLFKVLRCFPCHSFVLLTTCLKKKKSFSMPMESQLGIPYSNQNKIFIKRYRFNLSLKAAKGPENNFVPLVQPVPLGVRLSSNSGSTTPPPRK